MASVVLINISYTQTNAELLWIRPRAIYLDDIVFEIPTISFIWKCRL